MKKRTRKAFCSELSSQVATNFNFSGAPPRPRRGSLQRCRHFGTLVSALRVPPYEGKNFARYRRPCPSRATAEPGKTLSRGPIPHSVCLRIETPQASRGRKCREECPLTIRLGVRGSIVSSPQRGPGRSPVQKWILCIF